jgi:hypothetical protein
MKFQRRNIQFGSALAAAALLAACGGGGGDTASGGGTPPPVGVPSPNPTATPSPSPSASPTPIPSASPTASPAPSPTPTPPPASNAKRWSDPATWGGAGLPKAGDAVVIPAGQSVLLDINTPDLGGLSIQGELSFDAKDLALTSRSIQVSGVFKIGSAASPFAQRATITLTGAPIAMNDGIARGINVTGSGRLEMVGVSPAVKWTQINAHAAAGATSLTLKESVSWKAGDQIIVAPTDFYGVAQTERFTLASVNGAQVGLNTGLAKFRWGMLQYVTDSGMSLSQPANFTVPEAPTPTVLDQRAVVGNLSRNIVIQGADDTHWQGAGFGAHIMVMGAQAKAALDGVELRRMGQGGVTARYPIHWHLMSYDASGNPLPDAAGNFIRNSAVWNSANRCVVIHATNGVQVQNNICYDIAGHAFFLEDAVERRNLIEGNLALKMRVPPTGRVLQEHEKEIHQAGPSGFWITNPDNTLRNNHGADAAGNGFWLSFPKLPLGLSKNVKMRPENMKHGVFEFNVAHSNRGPGVLLEWVPMDDAGNVTGNKYIPTSDEGPDRFADNRVRFELKRVTSYKNNDGGYRNRVSAPDYLEWVTADNAGTVFAGAGDDGWIKRGLVVGTSLNNLTPQPISTLTDPQTAFASYHSTFNMRNNVIVNMPLTANAPWGGVFKTDDYYITAVDRGLVRNGGNKLVASHPGLRTLPPNRRTDAALRPNSNWTLSGALWDAHGYWGPAGNYWVYDEPFLTAGATCQKVAPVGGNGASCNGEYYGVGGFITDFDTRPYSFMAAISAKRVDDTGNEIGRWDVADGNTSWALGNMRHFAARPGARYVLSFPGNALPKRFETTITNVQRAGDVFVLGVAFDGTVTPTTARVGGNGTNINLSASPSMADMLSRAGTHYYQDRIANVLWVKVVRGAIPLSTSSDPLADQMLYQDIRYSFR